MHYAWNSTGHTNSLTPVFAKGTGASLLSAYATAYDAGWGLNYLDNTSIFQTIYSATVPEPSSLAAIGFGLCALAACRRRARGKRPASK